MKITSKWFAERTSRLVKEEVVFTCISKYSKALKEKLTFNDTQKTHTMVLPRSNLVFVIKPHYGDCFKIEVWAIQCVFVIYEAEQVLVFFENASYSSHGVSHEPSSL